ncbi:spore-associated protein A [Streptomyces sp. NBC_00111]|uniref:spore-associated protein A n=1 Tax=unclassified Streptomyces TaxID=2593676 RepID=UPI003243D88A
MRPSMRRTVTGGALAMTFLGAGLVAAPSASAAAAYNGACGSGYSVVNSGAVGTRGMTYLTYSAATGKNCIVTIRNTPGTGVYIYAGFQLAGQGSTAVDDQGTYTTYAGPVYINGNGSCIDWSGAIGPAPEQYVIRYATNCG